MQHRNPTISKGIDWMLVWLYALIVIFGIVCIYSVEYKSTDDLWRTLTGFKKNYSKQLFFFAACSVLAVFILLTDSKLFTATSNISYLVGIVLILATFVVGKEIKGSKSWIPLGFMNLQPVELCKIFTALALSKYLSMPEMDFKKPKSQLIAAAIAFSPGILSILQGETGLAMVYFSFLIPMYREGLPGFYLISLIGLGSLIVISLVLPAITILVSFTLIALGCIYFLRRQFRRNRSLLTLIIAVWIFSSLIATLGVKVLMTKVFKPYQAARIYSMVGKTNPYIDINTANLSAKDLEQIEKDKRRAQAAQNYNVNQSKIAIGSGGITGKGFLKGTQTRGDFVPEQHTDFIFTSVGENFGLLGTGVLMIVYLFFLLRIITIAERQRSTFSRVYAYSVAGIMFFHIVVNICVTVGLAPVIGITLPLMSYGGSSLLTFTILIFVLIKLDADRQMVLR
ncbi:MAG: rod shape-determining protein RodA [Chitinophagaceae bacterium]|nr:rod shape-determining protein RodA [Chitinophagaceae bacterium]